MDKEGKILIIDDEKMNRDLLYELLKEDYQIMVASCGLKAMKALSTLEKLPDLILLDVMMPEMDGYEVCLKLKNNDLTKDIPVIFVTAMGETRDESKGFSMGAVDYITKPVSPPIVQARVKTHIRLKHKVDLLERMVSIDGLTEIPNRRAFDDTLEREWKQSQRDKTYLSVLMMDVDKFKQYNDNYGHSAGDDCLRKVAKALENSLQRPTDFIARYGGEEFCAILPNTDKQQALVVGEKFRVAIEQLQLVHEYSEAAPHITVSIGAATSNQFTNHDPSELQKLADDCLYQSKEAGRNRVLGEYL